MKILLTGGGTMGSVSPLLAVLPELQKRGHDVRFLGTYKGPERAILEDMNVPFKPIVTWKLRRYITWRHLLMPFEAAVAKWQSFWYLLRERPDMIVSTGGFMSTPVIWMGCLLRIPSVVHQQDVVPGLANKLVKPVASKFTVTFEDSVKHFPEGKTEWIGNPVRDLTPTTDEFELDANYPTVFIIGGGTGARDMNALVTPELCEVANVIHGTGGRTEKMQAIEHPRYHARDFLKEEYKEALAKADVVVSRAGLGAMTEFAAAGKATMLIPMPNSHQEPNAKYLGRTGAAVVLSQQGLTPEVFTAEVKKLLESAEERTRLSERILEQTHMNANTRFIAILESFA